MRNTIVKKNQKRILIKEFLKYDIFFRVVYRLSSIALSGVVDFLYDIVIGFRHRFAPQFIESLDSNWLDVLRNDSRNVTLFMPFEAHTSLRNLNSSFNLNNSRYKFIYTYRRYINN